MNQTTLLLKAILAMQILMLTLFICSYLSDSSMRTEYENQMKQYRAAEVEYEKGFEGYQKQAADYNAQLAAWQKENFAYVKAVSTNSVSQPPKQ
jgi:hypothetical protein